ncbi:tail protein [Bacillus phage Eldridge]|uniref:Putative tail spike protein n=1 Tax=Bacillus phage Eldridge TaxID=1776293 RepID=A0A0Y0AE86_9CAUD|nr:tail protein [Bacillus phage Eldridge]AMB18665.1 putative tail spike protein [Bacillus phage Eldridge]
MASITKYVKMLMRKGLKADIKTLDEAEIGLATDTKEVFVGTSTGNVQLAKQADVKANQDKIGVLQELGTSPRTVVKTVSELSVNVKDFGVLGDGITDDTLKIQEAINYALSYGKKLYFPKGDYLVGSNTTVYNYFVGIFTAITSVDGFTIEGNNATIIDGRNMSSLGSKYCPVFLFDTCKNIMIKGLHYKCNDMNYVLATDMGYRGATYVMFLNETINVSLDYNVYNARYGVKFGDYNNPQYQGANGMVNLTAKIRADYTGYPVSIEMGRHLDIDVTAVEFHRVAYLAGVQDVKIRAAGRNQYIANAYVLLTDTSYLADGVMSYRGCSHVDANVRDTGSTVASTDSNLFGFQLYSAFGSSQVSRTNQVEKFSNIKLVGTVSKETTADVRAFRTNFNGTIADIIENIEIEFSAHAPKAINYFRLTTDNAKIVRNFIIKNTSVDGAGWSTFQLGSGTEVTIRNSKLYQLTFNNLAGGRVFMQDSNIYQIKPNDPSYQCSNLFFDNVTYTSFLNTSCFPQIFNSGKYDMSFITPEMFGAKGDCILDSNGNFVSGTDDTASINSAVAYAISNKKDIAFSPKKVYKVYAGSVITGGDKSYSTSGIFNFNSVDGLKIVGNHAKIYDARTRGSLGSTATGVFFLKGCTNITFDNLDYIMAPQALDFSTLQYQGGSFIKLHGDNDNIKIDAIVENARYGVKSGEFNVHNFAEINDANGSRGGLTNSKIRIKATNTGYPVAIEFGRNLDVEINCEQIHRMGYFCGTSDSRIRAIGKSDYATHALVLIKDGRYYDKNGVLTFRGCKNLDVYVHDTGSTINASSPSGINQLFTVEVYTPDLVPRTSVVTFEEINCKGKIGLNSQAVGSWMTIDSTVTTADVYRNINFSVVDDSGGNSGSFNSRLFRFVNLNGANCKVENIRLKDVYTTKDLYFGSKIAATFELDNTNATNLYYDNGTLAGANGAEKLSVRNSVFTNISLTSTAYNAAASLFLEYVTANIQLTHLNLFSGFEIQTRARRRGTTAQRPFINTNFLAKERCMVGVPFIYYDTTLNKMIMVSATAQAWLNLDGTPVT